MVEINDDLLELIIVSRKQYIIINVKYCIKKRISFKITHGQQVIEYKPALIIFNFSSIINLTSVFDI